MHLVGWILKTQYGLKKLLLEVVITGVVKQSILRTAGRS